MKNSFLFSGMAIIASLLMMSCENSGGSSPTPDKSTTKLWPRYDETSKQWGYMNASGEWAFNARFNVAYEFSGNYALARTGNVLEFIGTDGNRVNGAPSFDDCSGKFYNGYMRYTSGGYYGLMNNQLKTVIDPYYTELGDMSDNGLLYCKKNAPDSYGYIDKDKKQVIEAIYEEANLFIDGIAIVKRGNNYFGINKSNQTIIQPKYPRLTSLGNERIAFYDSERRKYGMMDVQGNEIGSPIYSSINTFTDNGLALVSIDGKYTYIDKNGTELNLANGRAVSATDFHEGIAFVKYVENGDFEAIGTSGERKFSLQKAEVPYGNFTGGLCLVWSKDAQGKYFYRYINTIGEQIKDWIGDNNNGRPAEDPIMNPGVAPSNPTDPTDPTDPSGQASYYVKHPWGGGAWSWQPMEYAGYDDMGGDYYGYIGLWGDNGFNTNTTASDNGADWFALDDSRLFFSFDMDYINVGEPIVVFYFPNYQNGFVQVELYSQGAPKKLKLNNK